MQKKLKESKARNIHRFKSAIPVSILDDITYKGFCNATGADINGIESISIS